MKPIATPRQLEMILKLLKENDLPLHIERGALERLQWHDAGPKQASNSIQFIINYLKERNNAENNVDRKIGPNA